MIASLTVLTLLASEPVPHSNLLLGAEVAGTVGAGLASVVIASFGIEEQARVYGRPDPLVFASCIALSMATNVAMNLLLLPELARITGPVSVGEIRLRAWNTTRWIAAAGLVFAIITIAGAQLEKDEFGRGQAWMAVGAAGSAAAMLTFDVATILSVRNGAKEHRP